MENFILYVVPLAENLFDNDIDNTEFTERILKGNYHSKTVIAMLLLLNWTSVVLIRQLVSKKFALLAALAQMGIYIYIMVKEDVYELLSGE